MEQLVKEDYDEIFFTKIQEYNDKEDYNTHCILINDAVMIIYWGRMHWEYDVYKIEEKWNR
jgi:hypothetical protein